jgi:hypothetical protein
MPASSTYTRVSLGLLSCIFAALGFSIVWAPHAVQEPHGLDFSSQPASGMAEIRAYYFGTLLTLSWLLLLGARRKSKLQERRTGLKVAASVLGLFALGRVVSFFLDGPPNNTHAEVMWAAEAVGSTVAVILLRIDTAEDTAEKMN